MSTQRTPDEDQQNLAVTYGVNRLQIATNSGTLPSSWARPRFICTIFPDALLRLSADYCPDSGQIDFNTYIYVGTGTGTAPVCRNPVL